jgi:hypothetical protein
LTRLLERPTAAMSQFNVFQQQTKRETGRKAQYGNIAAAKVRIGTVPARDPASGEWQELT